MSVLLGFERLRNPPPAAEEDIIVHRMSGLDASFYLIEDENTPLHVAALIILDGPPPSYGDLVRLIAAKLPQVERYRQRVRSVPFHLGRPVWVDDPHFQILYHVRHTAVPSPGSDEQLRNLAGRLLGQRLDSKKPLWEMWLIEGLDNGRWALLVKVHHAMVDGVAGMDLMTELFDVSPDAEIPAAQPWEPRAEPSDLALLADAVWSNATQPIRFASSLPNLASVARKAPQVLDYAGGLVRQLSRFTQNSASVLNGPLGPHRRWCWQRASLNEVKIIRAAFGGTVNDVVLAAVTRGFRDQLAARGMLEPGMVVRSGVPVSVRTADQKGSLDNRVSAVFVNLPVGEEDPLRRLALIRDQMDDLKATSQEASGA
ncbi:MAG: wax ester/triacylglycerol synthase family O-acyltransferase, partial [Streptosporangiaceae bacterium]